MGIYTGSWNRSGWTILEYCIALAAVIGVFMGLSGQYSQRMQQAGNDIANQFEPVDPNTTTPELIDQILDF
jgi:hypothetical protein